jgi:hypothetical protein
MRGYGIFILWPCIFLLYPCVSFSTIIGIYLLDLYVLTFHDMGYGTGKG